MCIELKIKAKHLALEPHIIRCEEQRLIKRIKYRHSTNSSTGDLDWKLHSLVNHRKHIVRIEARATHLARAYLANKPYARCEPSRIDDHYYKMYVVPRIVAMVAKYGIGPQRKITKDDIVAWSKAPIV